MKILLYNYAQPDEGGGGGVSVYQQNLASTLAALGHTVVMLSSGLRYTLPRSRAFLRHRDDAYARADIVNSPVVAPARDTFYQLGPYNHSDGLDHIPGLLRDRFGDIDVFHFQNLEGLTRRFFPQLRTTFPTARLLYSVHNYNLVCPQVHLWHQDRELCVDYRDGQDCTNCLVGHTRQPHHPQVRPVEAFLGRLGLPRTSIPVRATRHVVRSTMQARHAIAERGRQWTGQPTPPAADAAVYREFRHGNVALCDAVFDQLLAVSQRTRDVIVARGVDPSRVSVSYIGTAHKQAFLKSVPILSAETLHLGYLGYARRDKGFFFLLDALETLPDDIARRVELTIAAATHNREAQRRIEALRDRFKAVFHHDGFTHATLDRVIAPVNLGIVPVLWEDNLPQVAIELVSRGIPILTSDRGGASEIADNAAFTFPAGNVASLHERLQEIVDGRLSLGAFWTRPPRIYSMEEHVADLMRFYFPARREIAA
ncbi:MAG: glycosyltransferase [Pseudomonadota bacterium]|nr:glycosyltransferase [Pseudomonadota bacterium]